MTLESLITLDQELLTWFNGSDSLFLDNLVLSLTSGITWIPLYVSLFILVMKNNETMAQIALILCCSALCIVLSDGVADGIVKPLVGRFRPSNDPILKYTIDVASHYRGTGFSFFSAHAANTMSIAVFFAFLVRSRILTLSLLAWSLLNGWTRLYLGVHYPGDVICGFLWGALSGGIAYWLFYKAYLKISPNLNYISTQYTHSGYSKGDVDLVISVIVLTLCIAVIWSLYTTCSY